MEKYEIRNRDGIEYAYVREPYIDLYRKRWAYKDVNVGRLDNGELLPTEEYRIQSLRDARSCGEELPFFPEWRSCGASYLLDRIAAQEGVLADLKACFGDDNTLRIMSLAYFALFAGRHRIRDFRRWSHTHMHPCGVHMRVRDIIQTLDSITEARKGEYFRRRGLHSPQNTYVVLEVPLNKRISERPLSGILGPKDATMGVAVMYGCNPCVPVLCARISCHIPDTVIIDRIQSHCGFSCGSRQALAFIFDEYDRGEYEEKIQDIISRGYDILVGVRSTDFLFSKTSSTLPYSLWSDFDIDENYRAVEGMFDCLAEFLDLSSVSRDLLSGGEYLDSKLFLKFVAFELRMSVENIIAKNDIEDYTFEDVLYSAEDVVCRRLDDGIFRLCEMSDTQRSMFERIGLEVPSDMNLGFISG